METTLHAAGVIAPSASKATTGKVAALASTLTRGVAEVGVFVVLYAAVVGVNYLVFMP